MRCMAIIAITSSDQRNAQKYVEATASYAKIRLLTPLDLPSPPDKLLEGAGGLLLTGGPDIDPQIYGEHPAPDAMHGICKPLDELELGLLRCALNKDMPVLAICRGMQLLNVASGGSLLQDIPGHNSERVDGDWKSARHSIFLSPGSKLAAILGTGGFFKVNSLHLQGLREAQKSPRLLASAYSLEDGVIEGLESPDHSWVVGLQCHPEINQEVPKSFANLFIAFAERAEGYAKPG